MVSLPDHLASAPVGQHRLPRAVMAQHQRKRLLTAAIGVFGERGYTAATVDDLVAAAGIGVGSFYSLCSGKEECLLAVYDQIVANAEQEIAEAASGAPSWAEQACLGLRRLLHLIAEDPVSARIALIEVQTAGAEALDRYEQVLRSAARFLAQGRKEGGSQRLPDSLEQTTISGIAWLLHRRLVLEEAASAPKLFEDLAELMLEPYLGEDQARELIAGSLLAPGG